MLAASCVAALTLISALIVWGRSGSGLKGGTHVAHHFEVPWLYSSTSATADGPHRVAPQVSRPWLYDTLTLFNGYLSDRLSPIW
jgi:hypothetical protein